MGTPFVLSRRMDPVLSFELSAEKLDIYRIVIYNFVVITYRECFGISIFASSQRTVIMKTVKSGLRCHYSLIMFQALYQITDDQQL